jgi:hypothetical protein
MKKETGLKHVAFQATRLCLGGVFAYLVHRILDASAMPAIFAGRHSHRWISPGADPIEFWFGVTLLTAAAAAFLWSFVKHLDGRGWRR